MSYRARVLNRFFNLLYGPLVFLHEPAGACLFGPSWRGRRLQLVDPEHERGRVILDLGCGEGRLLAAMQKQGLQPIGVDPSPAMLFRASKRSHRLIRAHADALPIVNRSIDTVVITYPGPWIREPGVWREIERVLSSQGIVVILMGGTVTRGRGSRVRGLLARVAYGSKAGQTVIGLPTERTSTITGAVKRVEDSWGTAIIWKGARNPGSESFVKSTQVS